MSNGSMLYSMAVWRGMSNNLRPSATLRHQWQVTLIVCLKNIYREWASRNQNIINLMNFWWHFEKLYGQWYLGGLAPPQLHEILDPPVKYPSYVFYVCVVGCSRSACFNLWIYVLLTENQCIYHKYILAAGVSIHCSVNLFFVYCVPERQTIAIHPRRRLCWNSQGCCS